VQGRKIGAGADVSPGIATAETGTGNEVPPWLPTSPDQIPPDSIYIYIFIMKIVHKAQQTKEYK